MNTARSNNLATLHAARDQFHADRQAVNFKTLSEHQLLLIHTDTPQARGKVEIQWGLRYALPFPYKLDIRSNIINVMTGEIMADDEAPDEVLRYAKALRMKRRKEDSE